MSAQYILQVISILGYSISGIFALFSLAWGLNKYFLKNTYASKDDLKQSELKVQMDIRDSALANAKTQHDVQALEREFALFKERYNGDSNLLQEQMRTQKEVSKEILHKVNNLSNIDYAKLIEHAIEKTNR